MIKWTTFEEQNESAALLEKYRWWFMLERKVRSKRWCADEDSGVRGRGYTKFVLQKIQLSEEDNLFVLKNFEQLIHAATNLPGSWNDQILVR